jgi:hypothetical protein
VQVDQEDLLYCRKCAVLLASQRFTVTPLVDGDISDRDCRDPRREEAPGRYDSDGREERREEVMELEERLKNLQPQLEQCLRNLQEDGRAVTCHYADIEGRVKDYYDDLQEELESMRQQTLAKVCCHKKKALQLVDIYRDVLAEQLEEIGRIQADLASNRAQIIDPSHVPE